MLHPERANHPMCELSVFFADEWPTFLEEMRVAVTNQDNPLGASLEKVLPGAHDWHSATESSVACMGRKVDTCAHDMKEAV